jgi:hypothetical protein
MLTQMTERIALYARKDSPGPPLPINIDPIPVNNKTPSNGKAQEAEGELTNGYDGGTFGMRAEAVKAWLHGIKLEEDLEAGLPNLG